MKHVCEIMHSHNPIKYGDQKGICRILGKESEGVLFDKWVKKTFNDHAFLKSGSIISNEALFCFDESSMVIANKVKKDNPQRFRNYSHIICDGEWFCLSKADKKQMFQLICKNPEIVSLNESGQKHIYFKHKIGFWQLDDLFLIPDIKTLKGLHKSMQELMILGFSQSEIITGKYLQHRILKAGLQDWRRVEDELSKHRNTDIFIFTSFMMHIDKDENTEVEAKKIDNLKITQLKLF